MSSLNWAQHDRYQDQTQRSKCCAPCRMGLDCAHLGPRYEDPARLSAPSEVATHRRPIDADRVSRQVSKLAGFLPPQRSLQRPSRLNSYKRNTRYQRSHLDPHLSSTEMIFAYCQTISANAAMMILACPNRRPL